MKREWERGREKVKKRGKGKRKGERESRESLEILILSKGNFLTT